MKQGATSKVLSLLLSSQTLAANAGALTGVTPFLKTYCYDCHGAEKQKSDIRLDTLGNDLTKHESLEIWQNVLDQLNLGEMPPKKAEQPSREEVDPVVEVLTENLNDAYESAQSTGGETVLRRLNRHELRNTLRDLLYLNGADYRPDAAGSTLTDNNGNGSVERTGNDPLRFFPGDEEIDGHFNIGDKLVMSDFLLKLTLDAVEETLAQATHLEPKPDIDPRKFARHIVSRRANGEHLIETVSREFNPGFDMMATGYLRYGRMAPTDLGRGIGLSARYRITIEASAHNPQHPWGDLLKLDADDPYQFCLNIADTASGGVSEPSSTQLQLWSLPDDGKTRTYSHDVWMDKTWTPWLGWENGPTGKDGESPGQDFRAEKLIEKFQPDLYFPQPDKSEDKETHENWPTEMARLLFKNGYQGPHIRIHSLSVEPLIDTWPPQSHTALYGSSSGDEKEIRQLMKIFAERAFRRPVTPEEIGPFVGLVLQHQVGHPDPSGKKNAKSMPPYIRAMQSGYAAIMCSPQFLYLKETRGQLDDFALASRLSYFLWSSMPDDALFQIASSGKLQDPQILRQQVERMLNDEKAAAFVRHFPSAWLRMDKLGKMPPSGGDYQFYKNLKVEPMLMRQVTLYFEDILKTNEKIEQFIDSDYTYMNQVLGKWIYKNEAVRGGQLRKIALNDPRYGGIFTLPGVMTATANGVDTSPVIRGTWLLENVLGTPPSPPPADVEPLPTDTREATTVRELLALHRKIESCNSCHRKIDPMGFAFENFDVVGRWRDKYQGARDVIDTSATLTNGQTIADIIEFKQMLKDRQPQIIRCLTEKMLTYATGRKLEPIDRGEINKIISELDKNGNRLRDLVHLIVQSKIFQCK